MIKFDKRLINTQASKRVSEAVGSIVLAAAVQNKQGIDDLRRLGVQGHTSAQRSSHGQFQAN